MIPRIQDPHKTCLTCYWFQFPQEGPRMRICTYPGPIEFERGSCKMWRNTYSTIDRVAAFLHLKTLHRKGLVT